MLRYDDFTPLRIQDAFIRVGDRPCATYLYGSFFWVSNQPARHQRLTTALGIGFISPAAGGKELQSAPYFARWIMSTPARITTMPAKCHRLNASPSSAPQARATMGIR